VILVAAFNLSLFWSEAHFKRGAFSTSEKHWVKVPLFTSVGDRSREGDLGGEFVKH
jgi:hypothetical protein